MEGEAKRPLVAVPPPERDTARWYRYQGLKGLGTHWHQAPWHRADCRPVCQAKAGNGGTPPPQLSPSRPGQLRPALCCARPDPQGPGVRIHRTVGEAEGNSGRNLLNHNLWGHCPPRFPVFWLMPPPLSGLSSSDPSLGKPTLIPARKPHHTLEVQPNSSGIAFTEPGLLLEWFVIILSSVGLFG